MLFELSTIINVYPFKWEFHCHKIDDEQFCQLITEDLANPLLCTLKTMETRIDLLKKQYIDLERDYIKKLTDKERQMYKPRLDDSEEYWKYLIKENVFNNINIFLYLLAFRC